MDASQELPICPICCELLGKYGGPSTLPCGHNGCLNCFRDVQSHNPACPLCRKPFDPQQHLALNRELRDFIGMATSMFMDDVTRNEGWEAFPTPQLTQEHYAHELQVWRLEAESGLPASLLSGGVRGLALMSMARLGAGWSCTAGTGVVLSLQRGGSSWSAPCAAACYGVGWGLQFGGNITDVILVLRTDEAVRAFASGQTLGLGGALGVAIGPVGRSAEASYRLGGVRDRGGVVGYCCSKGAFLGLSVEGSVTCVRDAVNKAFYGYGVTARQLLVDCSVPQPPAAALLYSSLEELRQRWSNRGLLHEASGRCRSRVRSSACSAGKEISAGKCCGSSSSRMPTEAVAATAPELHELHDVNDVLNVDFFEQLSEEEEMDGQAVEPGYLAEDAAAAPSAPPMVMQGRDIGGSASSSTQHEDSRWVDELPTVPRGQALVTSAPGAVADPDEGSEELLYELSW
eukprot:gene9611-9772_t